MPNRYTFNTTLDGYINAGEPGGKFNKMSFSFQIPPDVLEEVEADYEALIEWAKSKVPNPNRVTINRRLWDEDGTVKYGFGGESNRPDIVFIDTEGQILDKATRSSIRRGTKVRIICDQKPYTKPNLGTTLKVLGVQVIELVAGSVADSGEMTTDDVISMFSSTPVTGFKASSPSPRAVESEKPEEVYDF